jgi:threonine dehydrogenase-like Zn-dependent dehydrogenase
VRHLSDRLHAVNADRAWCYCCHLGLRSRGKFAIRSALLLGAGRVIAIDEVAERLAMAEAGGAETIDFSKTDIYDELMKRTDKRGPDSCIDAVGCEASGRCSR